MARSGAWAGWIGFAGLLMIVIGALDFFQGLIAIVRGYGYFYSSNTQQIVIFDTTTWGWLTLLWGIVLFFAGFGLVGGKSWARWFAIVVGCLTFVEQLGFVGQSSNPLWSLTILALTIIVLYALIVRWDDREAIT